ncbi:MAG TPA: EF-P beta-lysylation protein EpmB [Leucothrix mucor]|nr:EF-P beta-lysylation protein EpmB [Leucothrix mucor]
MITGIEIKNKSLNQQINLQKEWQRLLAEAIRDPVELIDYLALPKKNLKSLMPANKKFRLLAPKGYVDKIKKGCWDDPLLRQILPLKEEMHELESYIADPVGDMEVGLSPGVLQKYHGRALIVTTGVCAVHCRYCFRREFPYADLNPAKNNWQQTLEVIASDSSLHEVILSGGDPLVLSDARLSSLCEQLAAIPHVKTIRFHTRLPVVLPERIDTDFLCWFTKLDVNKVMVIHANHANEIDASVGDKLRLLAYSGCVLLNQSVLLKGVNDSTEVLNKLSHRLLEYQTLPYYLHLLDKVKGAAHFDVDETKALSIIEELRNTLPGYLVPKLVREVSGKRSKTAIV